MRSVVKPTVIRLLPRPNFRYTNLMHIYQPFILQIAASVAYTALDTERDFEIAALVAAEAHTVLFRADQVLALCPALERFAESVEYRPPPRLLQHPSAVVLE